MLWAKNSKESPINISCKTPINLASEHCKLIMINFLLKKEFFFFMILCAEKSASYFGAFGAFRDFSSRQRFCPISMTSFFFCFWCFSCFFVVYVIVTCTYVVRVFFFLIFGAYRALLLCMTYYCVFGCPALVLLVLSVPFVLFRHDNGSL